MLPPTNHTRDRVHPFNPEAHIEQRDQLGTPPPTEQPSNQARRPKAQLAPIHRLRKPPLPQSKSHHIDTMEREKGDTERHALDLKTTSRRSLTPQARMHPSTNGTDYLTTRCHKRDLQEEPTTHLLDTPRTTARDPQRNPKPEQRETTIRRPLVSNPKSERNHTATKPCETYPATHVPSNSKDTPPRQGKTHRSEIWSETGAKPREKRSCPQTPSTPLKSPPICYQDRRIWTGGRQG